MKVGFLPYFLRLDRMDQAVAQATPTVVDVEVHRPPPTPALRTTVPVVSRQWHRSSGQALPNGVGSESDEDNCSLPVMNLGRSVKAFSQAGQSLSLRDVSLTDVFSRMRGLRRTTTNSDDGVNEGKRKESNGDTWSE